MRKQRFLQYLVILVALFFKGETPSQVVSPDIQKELEEFLRRDGVCRFLGNDRVELKNNASGKRIVKSLREPSSGQIYSWAHSQGIPTLEIDPSTIDTSLYSGMYRLWTSYPLSSDGPPAPVISDFNRDGKPDICGLHKTTVFPFIYSARFYSIDSTGQPTLSYTFDPYPGGVNQTCDVDDDGLRELMFRYSSNMSDFEQPSDTSLPTRYNFSHTLWQASSGVTEEPFIGSLDRDVYSDFLYTGDDSTDSHLRIYVAEYRGGENNFERIWEVRPQDFSVGFAVGDFDNDGYAEFAFGDIAGGLFLYENVRNDTYRLTWQDTTPFVNLYFFTQGDVDDDESPEFFVGASLFSSGTWVTVYETDSNNHYSARFLIHVLSGSIIIEPTFLTADLDNDGKLEFIMFAGSHLYVFKSSVNDNYYLWYYKHAPVGDAVRAYDFFDSTGKKSLVVSRDSTDSFGALHLYSEIYRPGTLVSVEQKEKNTSNSFLLENYPNPFNTSTTIKYSIEVSQAVRLRVFNILGQCVETLVDGTQSGGTHTISWDAGGLPSGIYFLSLERKGGMKVRKLILLK